MPVSSTVIKKRLVRWQLSSPSGWSLTTEVLIAALTDLMCSPTAEEQGQGHAEGGRGGGAAALTDLMCSPTAGEQA